MGTPTTDTVIIGGGQAGLAMSRSLVRLGIDHMVLERGEVAQRWRSERWDSLRLLTPNWQSRLPGWSYQGDDPDGFMTMPEVVDYLDRYSKSFEAPVQTHTTVERVRVVDDRCYQVDTNHGPWRCTNVVIATGACDVPYVPPMASNLPSDVHQLTPSAYRNPAQLPAGGVLVVGASASGAQLADELRRSGRDVVLAVGDHVRMPRRYRGRDIQRWLDQTGIWDMPAGEVRDLEKARRAPSLQLVGSTDDRNLDLGTLQDIGVEVMGRLDFIEGHTAAGSGCLAASVERSERRMHRLLDQIDAYVDIEGLSHEVDAPDRPDPIAVPSSFELLDLHAAGIGTVLWATGFRRSYPWLEVPVLDGRGDIAHREGVTAVAGLYVLGMPLLGHRNSTFIDGVGRDAVRLAAHLAARSRSTSHGAVPTNRTDWS